MAYTSAQCLCHTTTADQTQQARTAALVKPGACCSSSLAELARLLLFRYGTVAACITHNADAAHSYIRFSVADVSLQADSLSYLV
jgi:hypothetical protein